MKTYPKSCMQYPCWPPVMRKLTNLWGCVEVSRSSTCTKYSSMEVEVDVDVAALSDSAGAGH